jgi:hypothetical protein
MSKAPLLFRFLAVVNFVSLQISKYYLLPRNPFFKYNPLNLIFLTSQTNWLLTFYFIFSFFADLMHNHHLKKKLRHFSGVLFALGSFICFGYFGLVHHSKFVQDKIREGVDPNFLMFMYWTHLNSFIFVFFDLVVLSSEGHTLHTKNDMKYSFYYNCFYQSWSFIMFKLNGIWPYPFQNELNSIQLIVLNVILMLVLFAICYVGKLFTGTLKIYFEKKKDE